MALYAFDGTWNKNTPKDDMDTNVRKLYEAYAGDRRWYQKGVGTEWWLIGSVMGGLFGAGGKARVKKAYAEVKKNFKAGDKDIDIVGFSRGAALALDFANQIAQRGVNGEKAPKIRFLGLWDTVASFGLPGNHINLGYELSVPKNVVKCFHALALDERRWMFKPERLATSVEDAHMEGRLYEVWFRGVHSDIGGGNGNVGLSSIALTWMLEMAALRGVPLDEGKRAPHRAQRKDEAPIRPTKTDPIKDPFRDVRHNDTVHERVKYRGKMGRMEHNDPPNNADVAGDAGTAPISKFKRR